MRGVHIQEHFFKYCIFLVQYLKLVSQLTFALYLSLPHSPTVVSLSYYFEHRIRHPSIGLGVGHISLILSASSLIFPTTLNNSIHNPQFWAAWTSFSLIYLLPAESPWSARVKVAFSILYQSQTEPQGRQSHANSIYSWAFPPKNVYARSLRERKRVISADKFQPHKDYSRKSLCHSYSEATTMAGSSNRTMESRTGREKQREYKPTSTAHCLW